MTILETVCKANNWQGGTIHQAAQQLLTDYARILDAKQKAGLDGYGPLKDKTAKEVVTKMAGVIKANAIRGGRNAWMPYNKALKEACHKNGIKKDAELRELAILAF